MEATGIWRGPQLHFPPTNVASFMLDTCMSHKDHIAFICEQYAEPQISFLSLHSHVEKLATKLHQLGIKKGDVVAIYGYSSYRFVSALLAVLRIGGVAVTTSPSLLSGDVAFQWKNNKVKLAFCDDSVVPNAEAAIVEISAKIPLVVLDDVSTHTSANIVGIYNDIIKSVQKIDIPEVEVNTHDPALILHSSGSTGKPKPVVTSHHAALACINAYSYQDVPVGTKSFTIFPMVHIAGLMTTMAQMRNGATLIFMKRFDTENLFRSIQDYKINFMSIPPSVANMMVKSGEGARDLSSLKTIIFGGAILGNKLQFDLENWLKQHGSNAEIIQMFGMTEHPAVLRSPYSDRKHKPGSSGCAAPNTEVKLVGGDGSIITKPHTSGELHVRGPHTMIGYGHDSKATEELIDNERFVHTGDIAYFDEDGYFYIVDRMKDLIKYMGQQVSATELDELILQHKAVKECAVIGIESELEGELPCAVVVLKDNETATEEELVKFVNRQVADHKKLRGGVIFATQLPRNPQGKLQRVELRQKHKNHKPTYSSTVKKDIAEPVRSSLTSGDKKHAKQVIVDFIAEVMKNEMGLENPSLTTSLTEQGMNSSGAILLRNSLAASLALTLPVTVVYEHPIPELLAEHLCSLLDPSSAQSTDLLSEVEQEVKTIASELQLDKLPLAPLPTLDSIKSIFLTGATGFVGCHMVSALLRTTHATLHCVVRAQDDNTARARVMETLRTQLCWTQEVEKRVVVYAGDLSKPLLGIAETKLASFIPTIEAVYHVGAKVNWVLPYASMRENVTGGAEILKLLAKYGRKVPFHLISTIGANFVDMMIAQRAAGVKSEGQKGFGGYALSKWAGEQVLVHARAQGLPSTIFRLPLVMPHSVSGAANMEDVLVRVLLSCIDIGSVPILPNTLPPMYAVAVDQLCNNIISRSFEKATSERNLVQYDTNDTGASWFDTFEVLHKVKGLAKIPLAQWSNQIKAKPSTPMHPILEAVEGQLTTTTKGLWTTPNDLVEVIPWKVDETYVRKITEFASKVK
eukprot:Phypoly_transcript_01760.p1 GENE.Phypoly_transcript_01760~~Phypoly_transcript_01760.p1  ORF type:complete len:1028 (+),score=179.03 Phypoly_transcript_01760:70-3153(+)